MNFELLAILALSLAAIPALMFLWNLPQLRRPSPHPIPRLRDHPLPIQLGEERGENSPIQGSRLETLNRSSRRESALTFPRLKMDRTHPECFQGCYEVQGEGPTRLPAISVLIPARNEAANLRGALTSVLANQSVEFEVVVLDDHSEDETAAIVQEFAAGDSRVRLESAPPLPAGWCGKQHACHVLSQHARHPLLVFLDADVRLAPDALNRMSAFMNTSGSVNRNSQSVNPVSLASGVPRQITDTLLEKLLIPLIHFVLLGFLPVWRMRRCTKPAYGAGCGQLFIARADAYRAAGGHAAIRNSLHDGLKLPRAFRRAGFATDLFDATAIATCRMYRNATEVVDGLTKNAHEGLAAPVQIGPWTLLLLGGQVLPWVLLAGTPWLTVSTFGLALTAAGLTWLPRMLAAWRFQQSWLGAVLHPVGVILFLLIQWRAFFRSFRRHPQTWKGRSYGAEPAKQAIAPLPPGRRTAPVRGT